MKLADIEQEIQQDSKIDHADLDRESLKIPILHAKYYRIFMEEIKILKGLEREFRVLKLEKIQYYTGKADEEVYKAAPLDLKVLKTEVDLYLDADPDLSQKRMNLEFQQAKVNMLESFIKNLSFRNNTIKNAIDFIRFKNGA